MLSESTQGMHNLFRLSSYASMEGYLLQTPHGPRAAADLRPRPHHDHGLPVRRDQTRLRLGQYEEARQAAAEFQDIFGRENFFCELMDHGLEIERRVQGDLLKIAKDLRIPLVATNDLHYVHEADAEAHSALLCVQSGSRLDDPNRFKFDGSGYYLKTAAEMRHIFRDFPEACDNTLLIAERCRVEFNTSANYMPRYPVPEGERGRLVRQGGRKRPALPVSGRHPRRCAQAGGVRDRRHHADGLPGYFLVVADFIQLVEGQRDPRGARARFGRRLQVVAYAMHHHRPRPVAARAHLRALPEPRPRVHARLRRRLR